MPTRRRRSKKCPSSNTLQYIFLESMLARAGGVELHAVDARQRPRPEVDQVQREVLPLKVGIKNPVDDVQHRPMLTAKVHVQYQRSSRGRRVRV